MKKLMTFLLCTFFSLGFVFSGLSQITLNNPSFEDEPGDATIPMGWFACERGTTPDILPGFWGVYSDPSEGETFVGIITRENGTFESIGQRLSDKLLKGYCYQFSIDLAHSNIYSGYSGNLKLRVWLGSSKCSKEQLIYESDNITHSDWESYIVKFKAENDGNYIIFEAFYEEKPFSFKGNILLDNISGIYACDRT